MMALTRLALFLPVWLGVLGACQAAQHEELLHGQGLLWRVEKAGAVSHVFGTVHSVDERVVSLPAPVAEVFAGADALSVEMVTDAAAERQVAAAMLRQDGRTLDEVIGPELFSAAVDVGGRYNLPASYLRLLKPWALITFFSYPPDEFARIRSGEPILDERLENAAMDRGIPVEGLETPQEQIAIFDTMPEADQIAILAGTLAQNAAVEENFESLIRNYLAGDLAAIRAMLTASDAAGGERLMREFEQRLVLERNHRMVRRMLERLEAGGAFVAVGALHLPGEDGILSLLERRGFTVSRAW